MIGYVAAGCNMTSPALVEKLYVQRPTSHRHIVIGAAGDSQQVYVIFPCLSHASTNSLPCQLNCVASRPLTPADAPAFASHVIEARSSRHPSRRQRMELAPRVGVRRGAKLGVEAGGWRGKGRRRYRKVIPDRLKSQLISTKPLRGRRLRGLS